jgi:hypothetical protein
MIRFKMIGLLRDHKKILLIFHAPPQKSEGRSKDAFTLLYFFYRKFKTLSHWDIFIQCFKEELSNRVQSINP